jgi:hypothetical protein
VPPIAISRTQRAARAGHRIAPEIPKLRKGSITRARELLGRAPAVRLDDGVAKTAHSGPPRGPDLALPVPRSRSRFRNPDLFRRLGRLNVVTFAADKLLVLATAGETAGEIVETHTLPSGQLDRILVRPNGDVLVSS